MVGCTRIVRLTVPMYLEGISARIHCSLEYLEIVTGETGTEVSSFEE